jgi:hypothetical protein
MSIRHTVTIVALACASASFTVAAQQRDAMKACEPDMKALCAGVEQGGGRIAKCLKENQDKVSAECKTQMQAMGARMKERRGGQRGGAASAPSN